MKLLTEMKVILPTANSLSDEVSTSSQASVCYLFCTIPPLTSTHSTLTSSPRYLLATVAQV